MGCFKFAKGIDIRKTVDSISCNQALTDEGVGVITDLILWLVPASDGNTYGFGDTGKIYKRDGATGVWTVVYTDIGRINGASEWVHRGYALTGSQSPSASPSPTGTASPSSGVSTEGELIHYFYWTVGTTLHKKEFPGEANWSDVDEGTKWPKTNLEDVEWHTMKVAGGELMICNGPFVAMAAFDESYTVEAMRVYPDELSKSIIERQDYVIIGTYKDNDSEKGALYSWKFEALNFIQRREIPSKGINGIIDTELTLMQSGDSGAFFYSDLINIIPITSAPGGGQVNPDGVDVDDGLGLFGIFGGDNPGVYTLGRKRKNAPFVLNLDYPLDCDEIGSVKNLGSEILISYKDGTDYGVKKVDSEVKGVGEYYSLELKAPKEFVRPLIWKSIVLKTKEMVSGTSIELYYRIDKNGDFIQAKMQDDVSVFEVGQEAVFLIGAEGSILEFKLVLTPFENEAAEIYLPIYVNFE